MCYTSCINHHYVVGSLLLDNIDCFLLARSKQPKSLSPFQEKELLSSFLNNSELTENMKINLSNKLGITQAEVLHFFQAQSKEARNVWIEAY